MCVWTVIAILIFVILPLTYKLSQIIGFARLDRDLMNLGCFNHVAINHNEQLVSIGIVTEYFKDPFPCAMLSRTVLYIDGVPALVLSRIRKTIFTSRSVDVSLSHSERGLIFKIIKSAKLQFSTDT